MEQILDKVTKTLKLNSDPEYYIAFSDVHGNSQSIDLIERAQFDYPSAQLVGLGDYIDGRRNSKMVLDFLIRMKSKGAIILRGNHEQMLLDYARGFDLEHLWFFNGGKTTLRSLFGPKNLSFKAGRRLLLDSPYVDFLMSLPIMLETPSYLFLHAGVKPVANFDDLSLYHKDNGQTDLENYNEFRLWARKDYFFTRKDWNIFFAHNETGKTIVTGHTPTALVVGYFEDKRVITKAPFTKCVVKPLKYDGEAARILIDNGNHSRYPTHDGNIVVLDGKGNIIKVYDSKHTLGISWQDYAQENKAYLAH